MMKRTLVSLAIATLLAACGDSAVSKPDASGDPDVGINDSGADGGEIDAGGADAGEDGGLTADMDLPDGAIATTSGPVTGESTDGITSYKGIPYAAPPVGDLRLRPPEAHEGWDGVLDVAAFGAVCPQRDPETGNNIGDEDCLTLNIWAPDRVADDAVGAPVMVFIHGGGFVQGESSLPVYDGHALAEEGVVVVTVNYRLGALGFLATEALATESGDDSAGNYGLLDQLFALRWLQDNIPAFGGDAGNVTIFGESAGGVSVCAHLGSPKSEGLFARGIIESGSGCSGWQQLRTARLTVPPAVDIGSDYIAQIGCDDASDELECVRETAADDMVAAQYEVGNGLLGLPPFGPTIDEVTLIDDTIALFESGEATDRAVITGSNADEGRTFTQATPVPTVDAYEGLVRTALGMMLGDQVLEVYPADDFDSPKQAWSQLVGDISFVCPAMRFAEATSGGTEPSYHYHFTRTLDGPGSALGAFHALELVYVFGTYDTFPTYTPTANDEALSEDMIAAWTSFARDGVPLTNPAWPGATAEDTPTMIFDAPLSTADEIKEGRCAELVELGLIR